jgi:hypothetical protein
MSDTNLVAERLSKTEILQQAIEHREEEVMQYQINIDNFTAMVEELNSIENRTDDDNDLLSKLTVRIEDEKRQQRIAQLTLNALYKNLEIAKK